MAAANRERNRKAVDMNPFENPAAKSEGGSTFRIFLCDDQVNLRELMKDCLDGIFHGHAIEEGADGVQALEAARTNVYDVILLDVDMPNMTGFEALEAIRADSLNKKTKIVMLTGRSGQEDIMRGSELGADSYITKPFDFDVIADSMKELFGAYLASR
jgi:DNA-binding response OmpR family regulator